jgi:hypothetical protein
LGASHKIDACDVFGAALAKGRTDTATRLEASTLIWGLTSLICIDNTSYVAIQWIISRAEGVEICTWINEGGDDLIVG